MNYDFQMLEDARLVLKHTDLGFPNETSLLMGIGVAEVRSMARGIRLGEEGDRG